MARIVRQTEALVSQTRLPGGGAASFAAYATAQDFVCALTGFGVRSLEPGASLGVADIGPVQELWFVLGGVGIISLEDRSANPLSEIAVQPGDLAIFAPGDRRGIRNTGIEPLVFATLAARTAAPVTNPL